jgi:hypothetical protein
MNKSPAAKSAGFLIHVNLVQDGKIIGVLHRSSAKRSLETGEKPCPSESGGNGCPL